MRLSCFLQDPLKHRGNTDKEGDGTTTMRSNSHCRIESRHQYLRRRLPDGSTQEERQPECVEVGKQGEKRFRAFVQLPHPEQVLIDVGADVGVSERNRLRNTVGAARVQDNGSI